jgi:hypothetical protein
MPLLYGEGRMGFLRLQEKIMKRSYDHSIFAWRSWSPRGNGFLAGSAADFLGCEDIIEAPEALDLPPYNLTNKGI